MRMRFLPAAVFVVAWCTAAPAFAEAWVAKMFAEREHDFGKVARGADTVYRFAAKNIYKEDIELIGVRSSCGCTTPAIEKKVLKTTESLPEQPQTSRESMTLATVEDQRDIRTVYFGLKEGKLEYKGRADAAATMITASEMTGFLQLKLLCA